MTASKQVFGKSRLATRSARLLLVVLAFANTGCVSLDLLGRRRAPMKETVVFGKSGSKIAMIEIDGVLTASETGGLLGRARESTVARVREQLDVARRDSKVRALLLRIDSPGGSATASDLVYREVLRFKKQKRIPVVVQMMGMATSGGYYIAMAADEVRALPTTVTGSIGVIFFGVNVTGLMEKLGVENQTITSGSSKDAGSPLREMSEAERAHLQSVIDSLYDEFRGVVDAGRPKLSAEQVTALADGRIFSARQALDAGLVDAIGTLEDAVKAVEARIGVTESRVVSYHRPNEWRVNLYSSPSVEASTAMPGASGIHLHLGSLLGGIREPGFHYLWSPGGL